MQAAALAQADTMATLGKTLLWTALLLLTLYGFVSLCCMRQLWRGVSSIPTKHPYSCCRFQSKLPDPNASTT